MPAPHALDLASQLEVSADLGIRQHAEAVYQREGLAHAPEDLVWLQLQIRRVPDGQHDGIHSLERLVEVFLDAQVLQAVLAVEESGEAIACVGISVLGLKLHQWSR